MNKTKERNNFFSDDHDFELWWLIHQTRDVLFRVRSRELAQYGVTCEQAAVLFMVKVLNEFGGKSTPGEISKWILREPHSVSRILTRMEKQGFITKARRSGKRGNEVNISLTGNGKQALEHASLRESVRELIGSISEQERERIFLSLKKIRDEGLRKLSERNVTVFP